MKINDIVTYAYGQNKEYKEAVRVLYIKEDTVLIEPLEDGESKLAIWVNKQELQEEQYNDN